MSVTPSPVQVGRQGHFADAGEAEVDLVINVAAIHHRRAGSARLRAQVELEHVVLPGPQVFDAVAVEIAGNREAAQLARHRAHGDHDALGARLRIRLRVIDLEEPELRAVEDRHLVAVGRVAVEVAGNDAVGLERLGHGEGNVAGSRIDDAVPVDVDQPAEGAGDGIQAIRGQLIEAVGADGGAGPRIERGIVKVPREHAVVDAHARYLAHQRRSDAQREGQIAIGGVGVLRIPERIAIGIDLDRSGPEIADLRPAIDRKAGHEVAARMPVAAGEVGRAVGLRGIALAVQLVAGRVAQAVVDRQRVPVVGQGLGEENLDRRRRNLADAAGIRRERIGNHHVIDRHNAVGVADDLEQASRLIGRQRVVQGRIDESRRPGRQVLQVDRQAINQRGRPLRSVGCLLAEQVVLRRRNLIVRDVGHLRPFQIDRADPRHFGNQAGDVVEVVIVDRIGRVTVHADVNHVVLREVRIVRGPEDGRLAAGRCHAAGDQVAVGVIDVQIQIAAAGQNRPARWPASPAC